MNALGAHAAAFLVARWICFFFSISLVSFSLLLQPSYSATLLKLGYVTLVVLAQHRISTSSHIQHPHPIDIDIIDPAYRIHPQHSLLPPSSIASDPGIDIDTTQYFFSLPRFLVNFSPLAHTRSTSNLSHLPTLLSNRISSIALARLITVPMHALLLSVFPSVSPSFSSSVSRIVASPCWTRTRINAFRVAGAVFIVL